MHVVHLTASTFFGGPERQMLGLADALPPEVRSSFLLFGEGGQANDFLGHIHRRGFAGRVLQHDWPRLRATVAELAGRLREDGASVLLCHGYKANLLGRLAARRVGIPAVAVSRGWTWATWKVRVYEWLDRIHLRWMDHVVAVSEGQAARVRRAGVPPQRLTVIRNSARQPAEPSTPEAVARARTELDSVFGRSDGPLVLAAGRLSPEKGFGVLVEAASRLHARHPRARFLHFGDGPLLEEIRQQITTAGLADVFGLGGFRTDLDRLLPAADLVVLPSFTEGLPNVALEASAAGVAVVATAVGGTPEVVADGETGLLVPPGQPDLLADAIGSLLDDPERRARLGVAGRQRMRQQFTFAAQAEAYQRLLAGLRITPTPRPVLSPGS